MKLFGRTNEKIVVASMARHDYVTADGLMMDGGQPATLQYGGYNRYSEQGRSIAFEIPQSFAELYNDYRNPRLSTRKYGVWNLANVKILSPEEIPDIESFEWRAENAIWGTNGIDGTQRTKYVHLKDCSKEHLEKIVELCESRGAKEISKFAKYWLDIDNLDL